MASPTQWTWVWVNSGSWWWTGRPGVPRFMGSQRVGHDWGTELNWTEHLLTYREQKYRAYTQEQASLQSWALAGTQQMPAACRSLGEHAQMWKDWMIRKRETVHRLLDVKGGAHFSVFPVFFSWSAAWTQLHQSSMCNRSSVHRVQVWATTQALNYEGHPSGTNLGFKRLKNDHPHELNSSGVGHYINSEQRWINHEANEASLSQPLLTPAPSKSHEGSPRAVLTRI